MLCIKINIIFIYLYVVYIGRAYCDSEKHVSFKISVYTNSFKVGISRSFMFVREWDYQLNVVGTSCSSFNCPPKTE